MKKHRSYILHTLLLSLLVFIPHLKAGFDGKNTKKNTQKKQKNIFIFSGLSRVERRQSFDDFRQLLQRKKSIDLEKAKSFENMPKIVNQRYKKYRKNNKKLFDYGVAYNQGNQLYNTDRSSIITKKNLKFCGVFSGQGGSGAVDYLAATFGPSLITTLQLSTILCKVIKKITIDDSKDDFTDEDNSSEEFETIDETILDSLMQSDFFNTMDTILQSVFTETTTKKIINTALALLKKIPKNLSRFDIFKQAVPIIFEALDEEILQNKVIRKSGASVTATLLTPQKTILLQLGTCSGLHLNNQDNLIKTGIHTTQLKSERNRIKDTKFSMLTHNEKTKRYLLGGNLQVTRGFGYSQLYSVKQSKIHTKLFGMGIHPHIRFFDNNETDFIVLGTPGLFHALGALTIINDVKKNLLLNNSYQSAAEYLVKEAHKKSDGVSSNITALIVKN